MYSLAISAEEGDHCQLCRKLCRTVINRTRRSSNVYNIVSPSWWELGGVCNSSNVCFSPAAFKAVDGVTLWEFRNID